ncbi:hypothetical protein AB0G74_08200 [Streptomyces sp. NPDC020875]|uniref:hypothetical protein n=1 Tax=Streptomyces sp. NPDC020875 TaxID=3154898 RepID=UPI0033D0D012
MSRRITAAVLAAAALPLALTVSTAQAAETVKSAPRPALLDCRTSTDGWTGRADCTNRSNQVVAFRAVVVCGVWPDAYGKWITLSPGQAGWSSATCGGGTGVGSVSWEEG